MRKLGASPWREDALLQHDFDQRLKPEPVKALTSWWQQPTREAFQSAFQANAERILREGQKNSKVLITAADSRGRVKFSERTIDEFV